jgi:glycosyltransferase involved in cell wall biosynthesis
MRIAYFAGTMKPGHDGVTRVLYRTSEYLSEREIEHVFFSPLTPPENEQITPMFTVPSIEFPLYKEYRFPLPGQKQIEEHLAEFHPDILHINSPCSLGYAAIIYGKKNNIPVVATYHTHFASYARYYKVKALERFSWSYFRKIYNSCEKVYVPSLPLVDELHEHRIDNLECIPHGTDTVTFHPMHKDESWKEKKGIGKNFSLLFVGRLVWEKDLRTLAAAYKLIMARRSDATFVLAGDGPAREELQALMPEATFLGFQSGADLSRAYASSDLFVFPSTTETFGNVTLEAMASAIPPICADQGGASGIIRDGITGFLTKPRDAEDLAAKIEFLLDHPERRAEMAKQAFLFGQEQTWERSFQKMLLSYDSVIKAYAAKKSADAGKPKGKISRIIFEPINRRKAAWAQSRIAH